MTKVLNKHKTDTSKAAQRLLNHFTSGKNASVTDGSLLIIKILLKGPHEEGMSHGHKQWCTNVDEDYNRKCRISHAHKEHMDDTAEEAMLDNEERRGGPSAKRE